MTTSNQQRRDRMELAGYYAQQTYTMAYAIESHVRQLGREFTREEAEDVQMYRFDNGVFSTNWREDASEVEAAYAPPFLKWWGRRTCFDPINDDPMGE